MVAGVALLPVAGLALREVRHVRELPFASLWCVYAALSSLLVVSHVRRRRRLPDAHGLHGRRVEHGGVTA